jgi:hypothetical protein
MRRGMLFAVAVVGAILALPGVSAAQVSTQDSVTGAGSIFGPPLIGFNLDARSGPSGENPAGTVRIATAVPAFRTEGPVTCLNVTGTRAVIGVVDTLGSFPGTGWFIQVTDDTPDTFIFGPTPSREPPTVCPPSLGFAGTPLFGGDIVVVDAPGLPTSKDQCTNGDWRNFPGFKNQGDCVSFVATGGKNPPANSP